MAFFSTDFSATLVKRESASGDYFGPSSLDPKGGTYRGHILSLPVTGFKLWFKRTEGGETSRRVARDPDPALIAELEADVGGTLLIREGKRQVQRFAAFFAWNYELERIQVVEATQMSVLRDLDRLTADPDYSDLSDWDLQIVRDGEALLTKYSVDFKPTKRRATLATQIQAAWDECESKGCDLHVLYTNGHPLAPLRGTND